MKGKGHFWPAYVDMMTVLLLVYLLISMIFQVLLIVTKQHVEMMKLSERQPIQTMHVSTSFDVGKELRLNLRNKQNYLGFENEKILIEWLEQHSQLIEQQGATIYATTQDNSHIGASISLQYDRSLEILRIMQQQKISTLKVKINNSSINQADPEFAAVILNSAETVGGG